MAKLAFLSRMGVWIRGVRGRVNGGLELDDPIAIDADTEVFDTVGDDDDIASAERVTSTLTRRGKKEYSLRKLQQGYDRVLDLMDQMQGHMRSQEDRSSEMASSLTQITKSMADASNVNQQQVQLLSTIAAQLETTTVRTQQLADALGEFPRMVHGQTEALSNIQRQLEVGAESDAQLAGTLQSMGRSTDRLGESAERQANVISDLKQAGDGHQQRLNEVLQRQTRQFTVLVAITAVLAVAAAVMGTIAFVANLSG